MEREEKLGMEDFFGSSVILGLNVALQERALDNVVPGYLWS